MALDIIHLISFYLSIYFLVTRLLIYTTTTSASSTSTIFFLFHFIYISSANSTQASQDDPTTTATTAAAAAATATSSSSSDVCCVCGGALYIVTRHTAHGEFFHRECYRCHECGTALRLATSVMARDPDNGKRTYAPTGGGGRCMCMGVLCVLFFLGGWGECL